MAVITDGAPALIRAVQEVMPRSLRQRCLAHKMRNLQAKGPEERWREVGPAARAVYQAPSQVLARLAAKAFRDAWSSELPTAVACFDDDFDACIAHLQLPIAHRRVTRTTNLLERLFGEERRRTKVIPHAFGERAVMKLMFASLIRASQTWRGVIVTEFERKQLQTLREERTRSLKSNMRHRFNPCPAHAITANSELDQLIQGGLFGASSRVVDRRLGRRRALAAGPAYGVFLGAILITVFIHSSASGSYRQAMLVQHPFSDRCAVAKRRSAPSRDNEILQTKDT